MKIGDIMTRTLVWVSMDDTVRDARAKLEKCRLHHLLVLERRALVGVLSDRDVLRAMSPFVGQPAERPLDRNTLDRRVHQIMTRRLVTASPGDDVLDSVALMLEANVSCLPIIGMDGEPLGIVTSRDMLRHILHTSAGARAA